MVWEVHNGPKFPGVFLGTMPIGWHWKFVKGGSENGPEDTYQKTPPFLGTLLIRGYLRSLPFLAHCNLCQSHFENLKQESQQRHGRGRHVIYLLKHQLKLECYIQYQEKMNYFSNFWPIAKGHLLIGWPGLLHNLQMCKYVQLEKLHTVKYYSYYKFPSLCSMPVPGWMWEKLTTRNSHLLCCGLVIQRMSVVNPLS